ncbi:MAG: glycosyltransferase [Candidatus Cloacimonetes bacterium]|nr:glycosyltransferase [Candidatus Cloacimonadota bacterium]
MKKIKLLCLLVHYAPQNLVATFRHLKFSKYLEKYGFQQFIFTANYKEHINLDLNNDIPKTATIFRKNINFPEINSFKDNKRKTNLINKILFLLKDILFSPDKYIWWSLLYLPQMIKVIKKEKIDLVMVTGGPFSSFITGFFLKKFCSTKLIIDFRDPWKHNPITLKQSFVRKSIVAFWEKKCVNSADLIIAVHDCIINQIKLDYNPKAKSIKIPNGFDIDDFNYHHVNYNKMNKFVFLYTGTYLLNDNVYDPRNLVNAYIKFITKYNIIDSELVLIGLTDDLTMNYIESQNCNSIQCRKLMKKQDVLNYQNEANILVHFHYPNTLDDIIALKICEYALANKPIISFNVKSGDLFNFLKDNLLGETADTSNIDESVQLFHKAYLGQIKICHNPLEKLKDYNIKNTSYFLASHLKDLL